jgi:hypothetical protein
MATLVRARVVSTTALDSSIPTPFPREQREHSAQTSVRPPNGEGLVNPFEIQEEVETADNPFEKEAGPSASAESGIATPNTCTLVRNMLLFLLCF